MEADRETGREEEEEGGGKLPRRGGQIYRERMGGGIGVGSFIAQLSSGREQLLSGSGWGQARWLVLFKLVYSITPSYVPLSVAAATLSCLVCQSGGENYLCQTLGAVP